MNTASDSLSAGCVVSGVRYEHGSRWRPAGNPCDVCSCVVGLLWRLLLCSSSSVLAVFSGLHRRAVLAVRGSLAARHAPTQLLLCPTAVVQFAKVNLMSYYGVLRVFKAHVLCVCGSGCGVNGHDYPNGAQIPAGDPCQDCTCMVRHENKLSHLMLKVDLKISFDKKKTLIFSSAEWKCALFSSSLSIVALPQPCSSFWRLLPQVISLSLHRQTNFTPASNHII